MVVVTVIVSCRNRARFDTVKHNADDAFAANFRERPIDDRKRRDTRTDHENHRLSQMSDDLRVREQTDGGVSTSTQSKRAAASSSKVRILSELRPASGF